MQQEQEYRQSLAPVNAPLRPHGQQTYCACVRIGQERIRVCGDFDTLMSWVRLALAEKEAAA